MPGSTSPPHDLSKRRSTHCSPARDLLVDPLVPPSRRHSYLERRGNQPDKTQGARHGLHGTLRLRTTSGSSAPTSRRPTRRGGGRAARPTSVRSARGPTSPPRCFLRSTEPRDQSAPAHRRRRKVVHAPKDVPRLGCNGLGH